MPHKQYSTLPHASSVSDSGDQKRGPGLSAILGDRLNPGARVPRVVVPAWSATARRPFRLGTTVRRQVRRLASREPRPAQLEALVWGAWPDSFDCSGWTRRRGDRSHRASPPTPPIGKTGNGRCRGGRSLSPATCSSSSGSAGKRWTRRPGAAGGSIGNDLVIEAALTQADVVNGRPRLRTSSPFAALPPLR